MRHRAWKAASCEGRFLNHDLPNRIDVVKKVGSPGQKKNRIPVGKTSRIWLTVSTRRRISFDQASS
jgi:hypothetical protein